MKLSQLVSKTLKETPREAELTSHRFLLRAGYMRRFASGIYGLLPLAQRSILKIEKIIREEMDRVGGQEVKMPAMMPQELWEESGRYFSIGKDMFRLKDRNEKGMVLGMTHEEPVVAFARSELTSYKHLPAMMYQIQIKFRDEPRPRGGLIRLREFVMKDAYSFHESEEDLNQYYKQVHHAYERIFKRAGCKNFVSVLSDNGMFGGRYSHEFMTLVPSGEDTLITCSNCTYKANVEIASSPFSSKKEAEKPLQEISTPGQKTIEELSNFLKIQTQETCKAVLFEAKDGVLVACFVRGDLDVVQRKIEGLIQLGLNPATGPVIEAGGACAGSTGPIGLKLGKKCRVIIDPTVVKNSNLVVGANKNDVHVTGFNVERDFLSKLSPAEKEFVSVADIAAVRAEDPCPECGKALKETRGIEIGNIFHLGTRYSASMKATYLDKNGKAQNPIMGCYGIGVTRLLPSVIEENFDDRGMILPISISPYQVHLVGINYKEAPVKEQVDKLYKELWDIGIEVLLDDRNEKPGSQFADADLIGIPLRVIMSPKTLEKNVIEFKYRDGRSAPEEISLDDVANVIKSKVDAEFGKYKV